MKRLLTAGALALALAAPLGGCATLESLFGGGSVAQGAPSTVSTAEKGLTVSHLAYQAVGISLQSAAQSGGLHGANAATAQSLFDKAGAAPDIADQADAAANAAGITDAVYQADVLLAQISALLPPKQ